MGKINNKQDNYHYIKDITKILELPYSTVEKMFEKEIIPGEKINNKWRIAEPIFYEWRHTHKAIMSLKLIRANKNKWL